MSEKKVPDYSELRKNVSSLQKAGFAPEKSQERMKAEAGEESPEKQKLTPELLKAKANEIFKEMKIKLKNEASQLIKFMAEEFVDDYDEFQRTHLTPEGFVRFMLAMLTAAAGMALMGNLTQSGNLAMVGYVGGFAGSMKIGLEMSKLQKVIEEYKEI